MRTMTPRQEHANNLSCIADFTGERYYRRMSFQEANEWLLSFDCDTNEGYPTELAAQRAWDCYFAARRVA